MSPADTKVRMIRAASKLFQRDGYPGTSWRGLVEEAQTPWGSAYHHFPGGKEQLAVAAVGAGGETVAGFAEKCFDDHVQPADAIKAWFAGAGEMLRRSGYNQGCPVATVALETIPSSEPLTSAISDVMDGWMSLAHGRLVRAGIPARRARELATLIVINLEGALLLSRVYQNTDPLRLAGAQIGALLRDEPPSNSRPRHK